MKCEGEMEGLSMSTKTIERRVSVSNTSYFLARAVIVIALAMGFSPVLFRLPTQVTTTLIGMAMFLSLIHYLLLVFAMCIAVERKDGER